MPSYRSGVAGDGDDQRLFRRRWPSSGTRSWGHGDHRVGSARRRLAVGSAGSVGHGVCATAPGVRLSAVSPISVSGGAKLIGGVEIVAPGFSERVGAVYGFPPSDVETEPLGTSEIPLCDDRDTVAQTVFGIQHLRPGDGVIDGVRISYIINGTERSVDVPGFMITVSSEG